MPKMTPRKTKILIAHVQIKVSRIGDTTFELMQI